MLQGFQLHCVGFPTHCTAFLWLNVEPGVGMQFETKNRSVRTTFKISLCQVACHQLPLQILQPGVQSHGLRFQSRPRPTARLHAGMIAKSSHKSLIHPLPDNSTGSVRQMCLKLSSAARQTHPVKEMLMFQNQYHNHKDVSTSISLPKGKRHTVFRINFKITIRI